MDLTNNAEMSNTEKHTDMTPLTLNKNSQNELMEFRDISYPIQRKWAVTARRHKGDPWGTGLQSGCWLWLFDL